MLSEQQETCLEEPRRRTSSSAGASPRKVKQKSKGPSLVLADSLSWLCYVEEPHNYTLPSEESNGKGEQRNVRSPSKDRRRRDSAARILSKQVDPSQKLASCLSFVCCIEEPDYGEVSRAPSVIQEEVRRQVLQVFSELTAREQRARRESEDKIRQDVAQEVAMWKASKGAGQRDGQLEALRSEFAQEVNALRRVDTKLGEFCDHLSEVTDLLAKEAKSLKDQHRSRDASFKDMGDASLGLGDALLRKREACSALMKESLSVPIKLSENVFTGIADSRAGSTGTTPRVSDLVSKANTKAFNGQQQAIPPLSLRDLSSERLGASISSHVKSLNGQYPPVARPSPSSLTSIKLGVSSSVSTVSGPRRDMPPGLSRSSPQLSQTSSKKGDSFTSLLSSEVKIDVAASPPYLPGFYQAPSRKDDVSTASLSSRRMREDSGRLHSPRPASQNTQSKEDLLVSPLSSQRSRLEPGLSPGNSSAFSQLDISAVDDARRRLARKYGDVSSPNREQSTP